MTSRRVFSRSFYLSVCVAVSASATVWAQDADGTHSPSASANGWYHDDPHARKISQISSQEFALLQETDLISFQPVVLPRPDNVVSGNDYFDWPIATRAAEATVVLFSRRHYHWGRDFLKEPRTDEHSGIRMITRSIDGGRNWLAPVDVIGQAGRWPTTLFGGWGGGLGVHEGIVYLALNEGVYRSDDKGATWSLISVTLDFKSLPKQLQPTAVASMMADKNRSGSVDVTAPFWSPGMRLTFDEMHGLTIWTTRDFKPTGRDGKTNSDYGKLLCAIYSPDFGKTWRYEEQALPKGLYLNEITPCQYEGKLAFFFRNGIRRARYGQGYSGTGWFPFEFAVTNVGPVDITDTPDLILNPATRRLEAAATFRNHFDGQPMELRLYSIDPEALAAGDSEWRFDGTLLRYRDRFGQSDGMNPVGGVVDEKARVHRIYVWAGDGANQSGIFEYNRTLDTDSLRRYLREVR